jgi:hypothetical protein
MQGWACDCHVTGSKAIWDVVIELIEPDGNEVEDAATDVDINEHEVTHAWLSFVVRDQEYNNAGKENECE